MKCINWLPTLSEKVSNLALVSFGGPEVPEQALLVS